MHHSTEAFALSTQRLAAAMRERGLSIRLPYAVQFRRVPIGG
ncbi:hypothetical protein CVCC1112_2935 [Paenarthrobacter nicotinovorans]|nr:hypothetical protein CVCC1112_2935 [Paenarthrobacter nicotinovorans]